jgi:tetratricopeptide (TPR) repeat protein
MYDAGVEFGRPFIAMEYVEGLAVDRYCDERGLDVRARLALFLQIAQAVAYAHGRLVIHRDIKPANVLVSADGHAHLLDFGIAMLLDDAAACENLTQEHGRVLTPSHASPEQVAGESVGVASDVYSLGVLLYELLTGHLPYPPARRSSAEIERAILEGDTVPASKRAEDGGVARTLRGDLDAILAKALKRDGAQRYATADALARDVERFLSGRVVEARPDGAWYRFRKAVVRHRVGAAATAAVLTAVLVGGASTVLEMRRAAQHAERAQVVTEFVTQLFQLNAQPLMESRAASEPTSTDYLDKAAQLIRARFKDQPDVQAALCAALARIYVDIGANEAAISLARMQIEALDRLPSDRTRRVKALLQLEEALFHGNDYLRAVAQATQAFELSPHGSLLQLEATAALANAQFWIGDIKKAQDLVAAAEASEAARVQPPPLELAKLLDVRVQLLYAANRLDDSTPIYRRALDIALKTEGPQSDLSIAMRRTRAFQLVNANRFAEARTTMNEALATLKTRGVVGQVRAALIAADFWSDLAQSNALPYQEALDELARNQAVLAAQGAAVPAFVRARVDYYLGNTCLSWGSVKCADEWLGASLPVLRNSPQPLGPRLNHAYDEARLARYEGKYDLADKRFREALELNRQQGFEQIPSSAVLWYDAAINLAMAGKPDRGEALLDEAPHFPAMEGDPDMGTTSTYFVPWARVRIRLDRGDVAGAMKVLPPFAGLTPAQQKDILIESIYGEMRCAAGEPALGLPMLLDVLQQSEKLGSYKFNPDMARLRGAAGRCALLLGQRKLARELAARSRAAFVGDSLIAPYYEVPLLKLERSLGVGVRGPSQSS